MTVLYTVVEDTYTNKWEGGKNLPKVAQFTPDKRAKTTKEWNLASILCTDLEWEQEYSEQLKMHMNNSVVEWAWLMVEKGAHDHEVQ